MKEADVARQTVEAPATVAIHSPGGIALRNAAARLGQVLDLETTALRERRQVDMDELSDRKNQSLLELSRINRTLGRDALDPELQAVLRDLRAKLEENRSVLELHLGAVQEVADVLATAMRDADSDGTYSSREVGKDSR